MRTLAVCLTLLLGVFQPAQAAPTGSPGFQVRTLRFPSGLRVVLAKARRVAERPPRAYVGLYVESGWNQESALGSAHFIEHVVANSVPLVPAPAAPQGSQTYAGNAVTKPNYTVYVRTVSPDGLANAIHTRLVRLGQIAPDAALFDKEKQRVITELRNTNPGYAAFKAIDAYSKDRPPALEREIEAVRDRKLDELWRDIRTTYLPGRAILVVAGDIDLDRTRQIVSETANALGLTKFRPPPRPLPSALIDLSRPALRLVNDREDANISGALAFQPRRKPSDLYTLLVLDELLLSDPSVTADPESVARNDRSPFALRLNKGVGVTHVSDSKNAQWGSPLFADGDPALYVITFQLPETLDPTRVAAVAQRALRDIQRRGASDALILQARRRLADSYPERMLEPNFRIVSDHLAALVMTKHDPSTINDISGHIRAVRPTAVRQMLGRMAAHAPLALVLSPAKGKPIKPSESVQ